MLAGALAIVVSCVGPEHRASPPAPLDTVATADATSVPMATAAKPAATVAEADAGRHFVFMVTLASSARARPTVYTVYDDKSVVREQGNTAARDNHAFPDLLPDEIFDRLRGRPCGCDWAGQLPSGKTQVTPPGWVVDWPHYREPGALGCAKAQEPCAHALVHALGAWLRAEGEPWSWGI